MNIIEKYKDWRLRRLEKKLEIIHARNNLSFNPLHSTMNEVLMTDKSFTSRMTENFVWFAGSTPLLRQYYHNSKMTMNHLFGNDENNFFWGRAPGKIRKVHSKVPSTMVDRLKDLILSDGVSYTTEILKEDGEVDLVKSENIYEVVQAILEDNNFHTLLNEGISAESWGGGFVAKISFDTDLTKLPILEFEDSRNFELITKRNRVVGIIFKRLYIKGDKENVAGKKYFLHEIYTTNEDGKAVIKNELYLVKNDKETRVPLTTIPETAELPEEITFENIDGMLAIYKPNKLPNKEFKGSPYGESDFAGSYTQFDGLDEVFSTMLQETRINKTKRYIPDTLIPKDKFGDDLPFNDFEDDYQKISGNLKLDGENKIDHQYGNLQILQHLEEIKFLMTNILNNFGLSPLTYGITGIESIASSENSQREREKVSIRTRNNKIESWKPFLEKLVILLLKAYKELRLAGVFHKGLPDIDFLEKDLTINFDFGDYIFKPIEERLLTFGTAQATGAISIEQMVEEIWKDELSQEAKEIEIDRLKMEKGFSLANEDNLLL